MSLTSARVLPDVQNELDLRGVALDRVGVSGVYYPLTIREKSGGQQTVTAEVELYVGLHEKQRGAHLSRLLEALHSYQARLFSLDDLVGLLREIRPPQDNGRRSAERSEVKLAFKYFLPKTAPSSGRTSLVPYDCGFHVLLDGVSFMSVFARVPVACLCPCSLAISDLGAHNQRAEVLVQVWQAITDDRFVWIEDIVSIAERSASSEVHTVMKREDEKLVTEQMFGAPRFVEDIVREVVIELRSRFSDVRYNVSCRSFESIHAHNAYAEANGSS